MKIKRAVIVYNPMSGRPGRRRDNARAMTRLLEARGIQAEAFATTGPGDATRIAANGVAGGVDIVISYGGDGTLNEVIQAMIGSRAALAVWPGGTANVIARELSIPSELDRLADMIAAGKTRRVALGVAKRRSAARVVGSYSDAGSARGDKQPLEVERERASDRYFMMMAGIGIDASIARGVNKRLKRVIGELAYWWCGIKHLLGWRAELFSIEVDGRRFESAFALIGKGKGYGGGMLMTPNARLEEPLFEVFILPPLRNNFSYLRAVIACKKGRPESTGATLVKGAHILANSSVEPWVQVDGEVIGSLPMSFEVVPDALSVIVPQ